MFNFETKGVQLKLHCGAGAAQDTLANPATPPSVFFSPSLSFSTKFPKFTLGVITLDPYERALDIVAGNNARLFGCFQKVLDVS